MESKMLRNMDPPRGKIRIQTQTIVIYTKKSQADKITLLT